LGFSGGASGKKPACQCRRCKRCRFDPWQEDPLEKGMATQSLIHLLWVCPLMRSGRSGNERVERDEREGENVIILLF